MCHYRRALFAAVIAALLASTTGSLRGADLAPGSLHEARFRIDGRELVLRFRGCPPGLLVPGDPTRPTSHAPVPITSFYMGQTEMTFAQLGAILGEKDRLALVEAISAIDAQGALKHLTSNPQLPAFGVEFTTLVRICRKLNALSDANSAGDLSDIETRRFRPPSHYEWQYAARAETTANIRFPHFHDWPAGAKPHDGMKNSIQAKSIELWTALGNQKDTFTGSQSQVVRLCSRVEAGEETKPLEVLSMYLRGGLETRRDYTRSRPEDPLVLDPPGSGKANRWKLHDIHESVCEWTIAISDRNELDQYWNGLLEAEEISDRLKRRRVLFIAGGRFNKIMYPNGKTPRWSCFAIWGGGDQTIGPNRAPVNFDPATGKVIPFSLHENENEAAHILEDELPGVRLIMVRTLKPNWLSFVRSDALRKNVQFNTLQRSFDSRKQTISRLAPQAQRGGMIRRLEHYRAVAYYRAGQVRQARQIIDGLNYSSSDADDDLYYSLVKQAIRNDETLLQSKPR